MSGKKKSSFPFKKELRDWGIILGIFGLLYVTGLHTEVIGKLQSVILYTGLFQPDTELPENNLRQADFDMPLLSLDGDRTSLEEFKGKTIFLNFWATWCPPCIAEMPNIQNLYEDLGSDRIVFVMVSLDEDPEKARQFIERKEFTFPVYSLAGPKPVVYNSSVVPSTYVISPQGFLEVEHAGMANYNTSSFKNFLQKLAEN